MMRNVLQMSFGGLSRAYYLRQLFFGSLFTAIFVAVAFYATKPVPLGFYVFLGVITLLYPYSRFVYETVVDFVVGDNMIISNLFVMLWWKWLTMGLCWTFAIFIAPIGLVGLYIYHWRSNRKDSEAG
ncbi:hypothetical protein [Pseudomonas sp. Q1-7]|uniref:hypothetical protein n=1 Tax=Pseudomonas sp. Q1-7 TaxID=3020843 RepID=UPI0023013450|nr:hypothetical protein [Pseudomonas sp. Q1-7]